VRKKMACGVIASPDGRFCAQHVVVLWRILTKCSGVNARVGRKRGIFGKLDLG
jgi:hypothetical protein